MKKIKILAIPGSLRSGSSNHKVIDIVAGLMPPHVDFSIYNGLATLPHFDGSENPPEPVVDFLQQLRNADGVFICTPEYAYGVPGTLKNALDWTVGSGEFANKPVAYITAATGGEHAHESLGKTLTAMASNVVEGGALLISFIRAKLDAEGKLKDLKIQADVKSLVDSLLQRIGD